MFNFKKTSKIQKAMMVIVLTLIVVGIVAIALIRYISSTANTVSAPVYAQNNIIESTTTETSTTYVETTTTNTTTTTETTTTTNTTTVPKATTVTTKPVIVVKETKRTEVVVEIIPETTTTTEAETTTIVETTQPSTSETTTEPIVTEQQSSNIYLGNFRITGYVATGNPTASGCYPYVGGVAMNRQRMRDLGLSYGDKISIDGLGTYTIFDCGCKYNTIDVFCSTVAECYALTTYADAYLVK